MYTKLLTAVTALLITAALCAGCSSAKAPEASTAAPSESAAPETAAEAVTGEATEPQVEETLGRSVQLDGKNYHYNSRLRTVLFMGIDSKAEVQSHEIVGNGGRADVILLFVLNPDTKTTQMVEISRDTIAKVDVYNDDRVKLYSGKMQINMQYAFGDSPARSCMLMKNRISSILYSLPINYYCSITMDGIAAAVDYLGGITLTLRDDWTDIDESYTAGATIRLDSITAERFIRYRDMEHVEGNDNRMARHSWFIREMFRQLRNDPNFNAEELYAVLSPFVESDIDADTLANLASFSMSPEICKLPGEVAAGKRHAEYHLDEEALKLLLLDLFYDPVD